jgi:hypothetical protein
MEFALRPFWLTLLVVFSESAPQERKVLLLWRIRLVDRVWEAVQALLANVGKQAAHVAPSKGSGTKAAHGQTTPPSARCRQR